MELQALRERGSSGEVALRLQLDDLRSGEEQSRASLRQATSASRTYSACACESMCVCVCVCVCVCMCV